MYECSWQQFNKCHTIYKRIWAYLVLWKQDGLLSHFAGATAHHFVSTVNYSFKRSIFLNKLEQLKKMHGKCILFKRIKSWVASFRFSLLPFLNISIERTPNVCTCHLIDVLFFYCRRKIMINTAVPTASLISNSVRMKAHTQFRIMFKEWQNWWNGNISRSIQVYHSSSFSILIQDVVGLRKSLNISAAK